MTSPLANLLIFAAVLIVLALLFAPRFGLIPLVRRHREDVQRMRLEDALKCAFDQAESGTTASLASLTNALRISPKQALALVDRMQRAGLVSVVDGRILLSDEGRGYALEIIRAHRLWERYLADETSVDPVKWHALAERQEHALTPHETEELSKRLGYPRFDPHGDPIPTAEGEMSQEPTVLLTQLAAGEHARVVHVEDEPDVVYAQLVAIGVHPGMDIEVTAKSDERLVLEMDGRRMAVAPIVAGNVSVARMSPAERQAAKEAHETLAELDSGEAADVARISPGCRGLERRRLLDLGILPGTRVEYDRRGLTGGLTSYVVRGTRVALRDEQARMISIHNRQKAAV